MSDEIDATFIDVLSVEDREYLASRWRAVLRNKSHLAIVQKSSCRAYRTIEPVSEPTFEVATNLGNPALRHVAIYGFVRCTACGWQGPYMTCENYPVERPLDLAKLLGQLDAMASNFLSVAASRTDRPYRDKGEQIYREIRAAIKNVLDRPVS